MYYFLFFFHLPFVFCFFFRLLLIIFNSFSFFKQENWKIITQAQILQSQALRITLFETGSLFYHSHKRRANEFFSSLHKLGCTWLLLQFKQLNQHYHTEYENNENLMKVLIIIVCENEPKNEREERN